MRISDWSSDGCSSDRGADYRLAIEDRARIEERDVAPPLLPWAERPWHGIQESVATIQHHWVDCLRAGRAPDTSGRDNLRTLGLVDAAYRKIGRAHVSTPVTNAHLVCRLMLEKKKENKHNNDTQEKPPRIQPKHNS